MWRWLFSGYCVALAMHLDPNQIIEPTTQLYGTTWEFEVYNAFVHGDAVGKTAIVIRDKLSKRVFFPGPTLVVAQGSTLNVTFFNKMDHVSMSVHWHGLDQRDSPWMDGVPSVTQEPIQCDRSFQYIIPLHTQTGTYWWHSHSATQYVDGLFGGLVIQPTTTITAKQQPAAIAQDTTLLLQEFYHRESTTIDGELSGNVWLETGHFPDWQSGLINGRGTSSCNQSVVYLPNANASLLCSEAYNGNYELVVQANNTYKLRIINAASGYTLRFSIDKHSFTVVAMDGKDIEPFECDEVYVYVAQRYDVLLVANQVPDAYWMRARTLPDVHGGCYTVSGVVRYESSTSTIPQPPSEPTNSLVVESSVVRAQTIPNPPSDVFQQIQITVLKTSTKKKASKHRDPCFFLFRWIVIVTNGAVLSTMFRLSHLSYQVCC